MLNPDASYVIFHGVKFYSDSNMVFIEGHEEDAQYVFAFPGEIMIMESFPDGVRVLDGHGDHYLIHTKTGDLKDCQIEAMGPYYVEEHNAKWRTPLGKI